MQKKDYIVDNKTTNKEGKEGKKESEREREIETDLPKKGSPNFGFFDCVKNKKLFNFNV